MTAVTAAPPAVRRPVRRPAARTVPWAVRWSARAAALALCTVLLGCSVLRPLPDETTLDQRLAAFPTGGLPLRGEVAIDWNENQVPFITAQHDDDLAFALGLVHAHLRLGQMEVLRRVAAGRISEMVGPFTVDIDHALRILNFGRGAERTLAEMPAETRKWIDRFVQGINYYQSTAKELPHEFHIFGLEREPWTARDVLTVGRIAGTDVNWLVYFRLLELRKRKDWPQLWRRLATVGGDSVLSFGSDDRANRLERLLGAAARSGSNSWAVAPRRSVTGGALMANDPHLGNTMPNLWILAGFKSPGFHAVGMMIPGVPFVAVGRNADIAWGGTNMRAASSDLYDISALPPSAIRSRTEEIKVRWWFDSTVEIRESSLGPVISDAPPLGWEGGPLALRWVGHERGDEITAMVKVMKARNFADFRHAFANFAVSAQNMIYADREGNIGQVMATVLPVRPKTLPPDFILDASDDTWRWKGFLNVLQLPYIYNPTTGIVASANNKPAEASVPVGRFFSADDRIVRIRQMLAARAQHAMADMKAIQLDVYMASSVAVRNAILRRVDDLGLAAQLSPGGARVLALMRDWDGHYRATDRGPVAFELVYRHFSQFLAERKVGADHAEAYGGFSRIKRMLIEDFAALDDAEAAAMLRAAFDAAGERLGDFPTWGDMHRLSLGHPLSFAPLIGSRYRFGDHPANGSSDTLMKTAHSPSDERHNARYGQQARHLSDLADMDDNRFLLLGGQDGWFNSSTALDHVPMWRRGDYIRLPMRAESLKAWRTRTMRLQP